MSFCREWLEKRDKHRKRIYNKHKENNFNDLWVKMDPNKYVYCFKTNLV